MSAVPIFGTSAQDRHRARRASRALGVAQPGDMVVRRQPARDWDKQAAQDLGGLFIDRLYSHGEDMMDEGARMMQQCGDDDPKRDEEDE